MTEREAMARIKRMMDAAPKSTKEDFEAAASDKAKEMIRKWRVKQSEKDK